jgi:hypothetical protein
MLTDGQLESGQNILKKEIGAALKSNDLTELEKVIRQMLRK